MSLNLAYAQTLRCILSILSTFSRMICTGVDISIHKGIYITAITPYVELTNPEGNCNISDWRVQLPSSSLHVLQEQICVVGDELVLLRVHYGTGTLCLCPL